MGQILTVQRTGRAMAPLWQHLDDTADVAGLLLDRWVAPATTALLASAFDDDAELARRYVIWLACIHDIGKATPAFTVQVPRLRMDTIRDNTERGLAHARAQGRIGGRPTVMTPERLDAAVRMRGEGRSMDHIAEVLSVGKSSVARALAP